MISAPQRTVTGPRPPELPPPHRFPLVATIAPLVVTVVLFAVTRSAFTLVFAALGPVVAVASTVDAALQRRRTLRRETARFEGELVRSAAEITAAHDDERRDTLTIPSRELLRRPFLVLQRWPQHDASTVRLGTGDLPSGLRYEATAPGASMPTATVAASLGELRRSATVLTDAPIEVELTSGIGIVGPRLPAASTQRSILIQLAATLSPQDWSLEISATSEEWVALLPHQSLRSANRSSDVDETGFRSADRRIRIVSASTRSKLPRELDAIVELSADGGGRMGETLLRPDFLSREEATLAAEGLVEVAETAGVIRAAGGWLPDNLQLGELQPPEAQERAALTANLEARVGVSTAGTLLLDLVTDGPHAIVGGTTGSGKSELLLSWVLGMAAERPPEVVTFLFVDFKGGASFGSLLDLPHSVGVITDLDAEQAHRALLSLAAELRHRERELAASGLRGIDDAAAQPFARLVVVVDEYAALVETFPSLHPVFADIAARGRSLGVHLVLCTQRPAGVVRDGILANCALRLSLRVTSAADSTAVLGTDAAAGLPARPLGRALVSAGGAAPIEFQVARSGPADVDRVMERWRDSDRPRSPWLPPLAARIPLTELSADEVGADESGDGIPFAIADRPSEQSQPIVAYRPRKHGSLLVVGAAGSGKSGVLAVFLAQSSPVDVVHVPTDLPSLWDFVTDALTQPTQRLERRSRVVLLDDIDSALANCGEAYQAALTELLARLLRDGPSRGIWCVLTTQRVGGALHGLAVLCGAQLVLRMPNRAEHALVGGDVAGFVSDLPPGAGHWRGSRVQVAIAQPLRPVSTKPRSTTVDAATARIAVVSTRPEQFATILREQAPMRRIVPLAPVGFGASAQELDVSVGDSPVILIADPDLWQSQWTLLGTIARNTTILFDGCSLAELRSLLRSRELPPPFPAGVRPLWVRTPDGELSRATLANG